MREILFKAKRIDNGEWVEGYVVRKHGLYFIYDIVNSETCRQNNYEVDPGTICQFTGLCDKNGRNIWENDICDRKEKYPEIVKMNNGDWTLDYSYVFGKEYGYSFCNLGFYATERKCIEAIGNVFDNPELLQEKSDEQISISDRYTRKLL